MIENSGGDPAEEVRPTPDPFSAGVGKSERKGSGAFPASSHPLLSPSPTEPLSSLFSPSTEHIPPGKPHPLRHPPSNVWASPKHQSNLSSTAFFTSSSKVAPSPKAFPLNTPSTSTQEALTDAEFFNSKFATSYNDEFQRLFSGSASTWSALRAHAASSHLRNCRFRSLCWRVFLGSLGEDLSAWEEETKLGRLRYRDLKRKYSLNPRTETEEEVDLALNNPLSQAEDSPWSQYFRDNELKQVIWQDVIRTFPEIEFFQTARVQRLMQDVLFVYAREHSATEYRQGMHELLAPLIFVTHCDQQTCAHARELENGVSSILETLLDEKALEPDSYAMFCDLMKVMEPLFQYGDPIAVSPVAASASDERIPAQPFQAKEPEPPRKLDCSSAINKKLRFIQENLLFAHDPELHAHLERLDIPPQIYGLRWVRLLFGREFPLQDLLIIWDAIFADDCGLQLVDYMFVAMLEFLRDFLLSSDYATCMKALMRFPAVGDAAWFIKKAFSLRDPSHPRPSNFSYSNLLVKQQRAAQARMARQSGAPPTNQNRGSSNSILTMVAGKQQPTTKHGSPLEGGGGGGGGANASTRTAPKNSSSGAHSDSGPLASVSSAFSRLVGPSGEDAASKADAETSSLFVNVAKKDRHRAVSEGVTSTKKSGAVSASRGAVVEPFRGDDDAGEEEMTDPTKALKEELALHRGRADNLEAKLGDVAALIQTCSFKMAATLEKMSSSDGVPKESLDNLKKIDALLSETLEYCQADEKAKPEVQGVAEGPAKVVMGVASKSDSPVLDDATKEVLRSAMEEAVDATEPGAILKAAVAANSLSGRGQSTSPSSESSEYSMVDANEDASEDIVT